jgi:hypothetical protein
MIILDFTKPVSVPLQLLAGGAELELLDDIQVDISVQAAGRSQHKKNLATEKAKGAS